MQGQHISKKAKHKRKASKVPKGYTMALKEEPDVEPGDVGLDQDGAPIKPTDSANLQGITTSSLDALQSQESRKVMDIVDRLRRSGLSGILQLPQLVVSGDQSSGKSSVLEAITEIPFPRKENLCTRFATEIILRRAPTASIVTKIIPDKTRPSTEKKRLEAFKSSIMNFDELPNLMDEATALMGLSDDGFGAARAFSRDVLSIEIAGPGRPHLTLVDLPGLIHSENKMQSKEDVELIRGLVDDYIKEKRTIVMAVVSAKNDYANQIILKKCREVDPKGHRTLGIITKPDFLEPDSENEASWIELAENKDIFFELGWHILKNRSDKEISTSFQDRNASENTFFSKGRYRDLSSGMLGIVSLRTRLSDLLYKHLKTELPALQKELNDKHREVCRELDLLGEKRSTVQEQRRFLMSVSINYQEIVNNAVKGHYDDPFFGTLEPNESLDHESNMRRLRAVVQYLNLQFANLMRECGQKSKITDKDPLSQPTPLPPSFDEGYAQFTSFQEIITRDAAVERVNNILVRSRGRELPCTFNPLLISHLFWEQSENWKSMAEYHIDRVAEVCSKFVRFAVGGTVSSDVSGRLVALKVDGALQVRLAKAKAELDTIIRDTKRHPITYDPQYVDAVQTRRHKLYNDKVQKLTQEANVEVADAHDGNKWKIYLDPVALARSLNERADNDMEKTSAEEALDDSLAYYEVGTRLA